MWPKSLLGPWLRNKSVENNPKSFVPALYIVLPFAPCFELTKDLSGYIKI